MIKIYKDTMSEEDRLKSLEMMGNFPDQFWTQSICTSSPVDQLREYMPSEVLGIIHDVHVRMQSEIENDFSVELAKPIIGKGAIVTIDRRLKGYSLPRHQDIPTGDYVHHIGAASGESNMLVSCVYYWNDDFEGGELLFEEDNFLYKPEAGDLVVFYSNMEHEILEIKSGVRYSTQYFFLSRSEE